MAEPFLRWVGGKRQLVPELLKHVPKFGGYYEPFVGGGAMFFALESRHDPAQSLRMDYRFKAHLNDFNPHLMNVYTQVRDNLYRLMVFLNQLDQKCTTLGMASVYKVIRELFNDARVTDPMHRAAYFIALNAWGFNGLCRFNKKGGFNVPVGKFARTPVLVEKAANLRSAANALAGTRLTSTDFEKAVESAKIGDFVYFDPPYIPVSATANFSSYTADGFGDAEQRRLVDVAAKLVDRGVNIMLSNSDTPRTRHLYSLKSYWDIFPVQARRAVNSDAKKRGKVGELIIVGKV